MKIDREDVKDIMLYAFVEVDNPSDVKNNATFIIDGKWYAPKWGCDSLQHFIDILSGNY